MKYLLFIALLISYQANADATYETFLLTGKIIDYRSHPLANQKVIIRQGHSLRLLFTDKNGNYKTFLVYTVGWPCTKESSRFDAATLKNSTDMNGVAIEFFTAYGTQVLPSVWQSAYNKKGTQLQPVFEPEAKNYTRHLDITLKQDGTKIFDSLLTVLTYKNLSLLIPSNNSTDSTQHRLFEISDNIERYFYALDLHNLTIKQIRSHFGADSTLISFKRMSPKEVLLYPNYYTVRYSKHPSYFVLKMADNGLITSYYLKEDN